MENVFYNNFGQRHTIVTAETVENSYSSLVTLR